MTNKLSISQIILWVFVIWLGLEIGAGIYEALVVVPLWASAVPDSVIGYYQHNAADPRYTMNAGLRFWIFATPGVGLLSIATLLSSFKTRPEHRKWRLAGAGLALLVVISTFAWFVPAIMKLTGAGVMSMNPNDIASLATWWVRLNWVRAVVYVVGWVAALRALTIPSQPNGIE
jgi:hypothetical protein